MSEQVIETVETISVPEAGRRYLGIGKVSAYRAAKAGLIPTIKVGRLLRVPKRLMERRMEQPDKVEGES
jgi:excisionase family DNA binding protein